MIGDEDSSVHLTVNISVPYGHHVQKLQRSNYVVKCFRCRLEKLVKENITFRVQKCPNIQQHLSAYQRHAIGHHCQYSTTKDETALCHDMRNCRSDYNS